MRLALMVASAASKAMAGMMSRMVAKARVSFGERALPRSCVACKKSAG